MKKRILFATEPWFYLTEVPLIWLMILLIRHHADAAGVLKYYPLEIVTVAGIAFIAVYFTRFLTVGYDEVRMHGLFSSRDRAVLVKGKTLIFTKLSRRRFSVEVFGNDGEVAALEWLKDEAPRDITQLREKVLGNEGTVASLLAFFSVPKEDIDLFFAEEPAAREYPLVSVSSSFENEKRVVKVFLKETFDDLEE